MRYVIYLRVSTDQQADTGQGLDIQEQACRDWLRAGRHQLVEVCTDAGKSGGASVAGRPGLSRALSLGFSHRVDGILVYRLDRLARDMMLQEALLADLHRRGKHLHSCSAAEDAHLVDDPDDPARALVRRLLGSVAAYERDMIRIRLRAGRLRKQLAGGYAGGSPPYGWRSTGRELEEVPAEQEAIRLMVRLHKQGRSYRQIAAALEAREIPSRRAPKWRPGTILDIVARESARKAPRRNGATPSPELVGVSA